VVGVGGGWGWGIINTVLLPHKYIRLAGQMVSELTSQAGSLGLIPVTVLREFSQHQNNFLNEMNTIRYIKVTFQKI